MCVCVFCVCVCVCVCVARWPGGLNHRFESISNSSPRRMYSLGRHLCPILRNAKNVSVRVRGVASANLCSWKWSGSRFKSCA